MSVTPTPENVNPGPDRRTPTFTIMAALELLQERANNSITWLPPRDAPGYPEVLELNRARRRIVRDIQLILITEFTEDMIPDVEKKMADWKLFLDRN